MSAKITVTEAFRRIGRYSTSEIERKFYSGFDGVIDEHRGYKLLSSSGSALERAGLSLGDIVKPVEKEEVVMPVIPKIWIEENEAWIAAPSGSTPVAMLRSIEAWRVRFMKRANAWRVKVEESGVVDLVTVSTLIEVSKLVRCSDDTRGALEKWHALATEIEKSKRILQASAESQESSLVIEGLGGTPRDYQLAAVEYLARSKRLILGDEMGLGKTIVTLAAAQHLKAYPVLIIAKAKLVINWVREARKWLPGKRITSDPLDLNSQIKWDVCVTNYEKLLNSKIYEALEGVDWQLIALDESTMIKNKKSKRAVNCRDIARVSKAPYRLCLSGTPVENSPMELLGQLRFLERTSIFGSESDFLFKYCGGFSPQKGVCYHPDELRRVLQENCFMRRRKSDVLSELPPKQTVYLTSEIDMGIYRNEEARILADHSDNPGVAVSLLRRAAAMASMEYFEDWIAQANENGERVIVFAHHIDVQKRASEILGESARWTRQGNAQAAIDAFTHGDTQNIVLSLSADAEGHNLTVASNVFFLELPWTPTRFDQATDRAHRIGQKDSVTAWVPISEGTVQPHIRDILEEKREMVNSIVDGSGSNAVRMLSEDEAMLAVWRKQIR